MSSRALVRKRLLKERIMHQHCFKGYMQISINGGAAVVHRLVAMAFLDHVPCGHKIVVDHIDNNPFNNHLSNLQLISNRENTTKDKPIGKSGFRGVVPSGGRFVARGDNKNLGTFNAPEEASAVYQNYIKNLLSE